MVFSFTGLAWFFASFVIGFFTYRTFRYWRKTGNNISKLFLYSFLFFFLFVFAFAIIGLFFADNSRAIVILSKIAPILQGFGSFFALSVVIYQMFSQTPSTRTFLIIFSFLIFLFLGSFAVYLSATTTPLSPFLDNFRIINWGIPAKVNILVPMLRLFLFLIGLVPLLIMLIMQYSKIKDIYSKIRMRGFIFFYLLVIILIILEFVFFRLKNGPLLRDSILMLASAIFLASILQTPKPSLPPIKERGQNQ